MADVRVSRPGRKAVFVVDHKEIKPLKDHEGFFLLVKDGVPEIVLLAEDEADE